MEMRSRRMRARFGDPAGEALGGGHFGGASSLWPAQLPREPPAAWGSLGGRDDRARGARRLAGRPPGAEGGRAAATAANDGCWGAAAAWRGVPTGRR